MRDNCYDADLNGFPIQFNDQVSALRDALSLYAVVRGNTLNMVSDRNATEEARIRKALFGDGTQAGALISKILIGASGSNQYQNIHEVLQRLGITDGLDRPDHFHIYLNPPKAESIGSQNLLSDTFTPASSDTSANTSLQTTEQGLLDYAQTLITGEELMFTMDVPSVPAQQTPIVLAQAGTPTAAPDYILKACGETISTGNNRSVANGLDPAGELAGYLGSRSNRDIYGDPKALASIKITLLEGAKHGELDGEFVSGRLAFMYNPTEGYVGKDKAIFMAEFEGKHYKIIVELHVFAVAPMENQSVNSCPPPKLIKVNGKPVSGSSGYDFGSVSVTFADLTSGALGQTTGSTITLDTTASGNGWFIDATPADNSEYLPTSNPSEWVAKAGSADGTTSHSTKLANNASQVAGYAAGKMDMLSVLLHEYGHALGIDHNADAHDYMGTTLTAGIRRLPTADELALMQQLIAQAKSDTLGVQRQDAAFASDGSVVPLHSNNAPSTGSGQAGNPDTSHDLNQLPK